MTTLSKNSTVPTRHKGVRLAVVGLGERAAWMMQCMAGSDSDVSLGAVVDPSGEQAVQATIDKHEIKCPKNLAIYNDLDPMLNKGVDVDGVIIGTRCLLHTPLAIRLAKLGVPIFLEKPVAISWPQLDELRTAYEQVPDDRVVVSFPLAYTPIFDAVQTMVRSGRLGLVNQIQAVNNVSYGAVYIDQWYRDVSLTGGLWLQKATHDFDYIHRLAAATPTHVSAMHSRQVWAEPTLNQDAGSALVQYDDGQHACYTQNFLTRRTAGVRGATITGEDATVRFDWNRKSIRVTDHHSERIEDIKIDDEGGHGGGDQRLARNFIDVIMGRAASMTPMADGLLSAATCLAARDAASRRTVEAIPVQTLGREPHPVERIIEPIDS